MKKLLLILILFYIQSSYGYYLEYDKTSSISKVTSIKGITSLHSGCGLKSFEGTIKKINRVKNSLEISINTSTNNHEFFYMDVSEFSMSELRSMNPILTVGERVRVEGQVCGSGGFFYPVNIIDLGKKKTFRGWVDEVLGKFGLEK